MARDYKQANVWYEKAAAQGDAEAQFYLGMQYANGTGVLQDRVEAHKWFNLAGAHGEEKGRYGREMVEKLMTPEELTEARRRASDWMKVHK